MSKQRHINVDATSGCRLEVDTKLFKAVCRVMTNGDPEV